jgi:hypothetical protein
MDTATPARIKIRRRFVLALYGLSVFWGIAYQFAADDARLEILGSMMFAMLATLWFVVDRTILGRPRILVLEMLFFITWPLAAFIHLVTTRGLRGFGYWLLHSIGLSLTMIIAAVITVVVMLLFGIIDPAIV